VIAVRTLDVRIRPLLEAWKKDKTIATTTNHQPIARRFERAVLASGLEGAIALSDDDLFARHPVRFHYLQRRGATTF
jgi:hypothetical protein